MNKKIFGIFISLAFLAMLVIPAFASPTKGNKVAVTLTWTNPAGTPAGIDETGIVTHRHGIGTWDVELEIDDGPTYIGAAVDTVREILIVPQTDGNNLLWREHLEVSFPEAGGGFEGYFVVLMDGVGNPLELRSKAHGLLHGTGAFEGQTINAGHNWRPPGPLVWTGYLLKPD